jgi:hypothetical protein
VGRQICLAAWTCPHLTPCREGTQDGLPTLVRTDPVALTLPWGRSRAARKCRWAHSPRPPLGYAGKLWRAVTPDERQEDRVIQQLCAVWTELDGPPAVIDCHPDREGVPAGCDAIVLRGDQRSAIEHTSVHTIPQRPKHLLYLDEFRKLVVDPLHQALPLEVLLVAVPAKLIEGFADPAAMAALIVSAVVAAVPRIPSCRGLNIDDAPGLGFRVFVYRFTPRRTAAGQVTLNPYGPDDQDTTMDIRRALREEREKMLRYKTEGCRTVLILDAPESGAFSSYFWQIFLTAAGEMDFRAFDEVIFAGSWGDPVFFTRMLCDGRVFRGAEEWRDFWDAQVRAVKRSRWT